MKSISIDIETFSSVNLQKSGVYRYAESDDFEIRELRNNATSRYVSEFIDAISCEILADSEDSDEICYEVAHKQSNSS